MRVNLVVVSDKSLDLNGIERIHVCCDTMNGSICGQGKKERWEEKTKRTNLHNTWKGNERTIELTNERTKVRTKVRTKWTDIKQLMRFP